MYVDANNGLKSWGKNLKQSIEEKNLDNVLCFLETIRFYYGKVSECLAKYPKETKAIELKDKFLALFKETQIESEKISEDQIKEYLKGKQYDRAKGIIDLLIKIAPKSDKCKDLMAHITQTQEKQEGEYKAWLAEINLRKN